MRKLGIVVFLLLSTLVSGETIRGLLVDTVRLQAEADFEATSALALEEMAAVYVEGNLQFLQAINIEIHLSNQLKEFSQSCGLALYKGIDPEPQEGLTFFKGERLLLSPLPYLNRVYLTVPIFESQANTGSFKIERVAPGEFPLLISFIPIMKGIPSALIDKKFYLTFKPVVAKKGILDLSINYPTDEPADIRLYLDNEPLSGSLEPIVVDSGIHQLRIESEAYKRVNASFTVESGKTSTVDILLEEILSELTVEAPQSAEVYLDGEKLGQLAGSRFPLKEGNHTVLIKLDDYSISKRFSSQKGKNYHLSVVFDIIINED